jgi:predicted transcriptional regulator
MRPATPIAMDISHEYAAAMVKVLISLPDDLLDRIDREAQARGTDRSRFLQEAALRELSWPSAEALGVALERGREALAGVGSFESAELIREQRRAGDADDRRRPSGVVADLGK